MSTDNCFLALAVWSVQMYYLLIADGVRVLDDVDGRHRRI
jgi:hypothetical protein